MKLELAKARRDLQNASECRQQSLEEEGMAYRNELQSRQRQLAEAEETAASNIGSYRSEHAIMMADRRSMVLELSRQRAATEAAEETAAQAKAQGGKEEARYAAQQHTIDELRSALEKCELKYQQ